MNKKIIVILCILGAITIFFAYGCLFYEQSPYERTKFSLAPPSADFWSGTDNLGIDIFAQLSHGYFQSMLIGLASASITFIVGGIMGVISGYFSNFLSASAQFVTNIFLSVPQLPIMITVGAFWGQSQMNIILIVAAFSWAPLAKVMSSKTASIRKKDYIAISKSYGASFWYILYTHLKKELLPLLCVYSISVVGKSIIQEASLAFLGLSDPTSKSWGLMINKAIEFPGIYFTDYWKWWLTAPLVSLFLTIFLLRFLVKELDPSLKIKYKKGGRKNAFSITSESTEDFLSKQ